MSSHSGEYTGLIALEQMSHPRSSVSASLGTSGFLYGFYFDCSPKFILLFENKNKNQTKPNHKTGIVHTQSAFHFPPYRSWGDLEIAYSSSQAKIREWLVFHGCTGCVRTALKRPGFALSLSTPDVTVAWQESSGSAVCLQAVLSLCHLTMDAVDTENLTADVKRLLSTMFTAERKINTFHIVLSCLKYHGAHSSLLHTYWYGKATRPFKLQPWLFMPYLALGCS